jgi:zinc/manganese transport system permease protein
MDVLIETLPLLVAPLAACVAITALHSYVGLHVIKRGLIFVDLALAQCAALGAAVAVFVMPWICTEPLHYHEHVDTGAEAVRRLAEQMEREDAPGSFPSAVPREVEAHVPPHAHAGQEHEGLTYVFSLSFALAGAVLLSFARLSDDRIPHEAIIGIIFVVCAALSVLILSKAPHGHERMEAMLVGSILFVRWSDLAVMLPLYAALGIFHILLRRPFIEISSDVAAAERAGRRVRLWDCVFYGAFAVLVTHSVSMAGVLVVFSYLIIPPACATLLIDRFGAQVAIAWLVGVGTTLVGLAVSAVGDMPTGPSLVSSFGAVLVGVFLVRALAAKRSKKGVS